MENEEKRRRFTMSFLEALKKEDNKTLGENGAQSYKSTLNKNLDLHVNSGTMRYDQPNDIINLFKEAYHEDADLALKNLFYIRDIEKGMGEKRVFEVICSWLAQERPETFSKLVSLVPQYGSYNDLRKIIGNKKLTTEQVTPAIRVLINQLQDDMVALVSDENAEISLAAKWAPSVGSKNEIHKIGVKRIISVTGIQEKNFRKRVSELRAHLNLVETKLTNKKTHEIEYDKVPSQAFHKYSKAFYRNDEARFAKFLDRAEKGEVKVNAKTLQAHQLVSRYMSSFNSDIDKAVEAQWKNLPKLENTAPRALAMVDVSGSMIGRPMEVAVSLGIYLSENMTGEFKDHFLTFSGEPELISLSNEKTLREKVDKTMNSNWGLNTNLESAYKLILDTAVKNNMKQDELPEILFILSDMQFDAAVSKFGYSSSVDDSFFDSMRKTFEDEGYKLPFVVHWNIAGGNRGNTPVTESDENTASISGFSQALFDTMLSLDMDKLESYTPVSAMLETLNSDRYEPVSLALE